MGEARRKKLLYGAPTKTPKISKSLKPLRSTMISGISTRLLTRAELNDLVIKIFKEIALEECMTPEEAYVPPEEIEMCFQEEAHINRMKVLGRCGDHCTEGVNSSCFVDPDRS